MYDMDQFWARKAFFRNVIENVRQAALQHDDHVLVYKKRLSNILTRMLVARCSEEEAAWQVDHPDEWWF